MIEESLESLKLCGMIGGVSMGQAGDISMEFAQLCYDKFEAVVEQFLPGMNSLYAAIYKAKDSWAFKMEVHLKDEVKENFQQWHENETRIRDHEARWEIQGDHLLTLTLYENQGRDER